MNDKLMTRLELRDHASLARSVERLLVTAFDALEHGGKPAAPSRIQVMQLQRMESMLADSARETGREPARLIPDPALGRPRSQAERQTIYQLLQRVRPELTHDEAAVQWVNDANDVLLAAQENELPELPPEKVQWAREELEPFLQSLSYVVQNFTEDSKSRVR